MMISARVILGAGLLDMNFSRAFSSSSFISYVKAEISLNEWLSIKACIINSIVNRNLLAIDNPGRNHLLAANRRPPNQNHCPA